MSLMLKQRVIFKGLKMTGQKLEILELATWTDHQFGIGSSRLDCPESQLPRIQIRVLVHREPVVLREPPRGEERRKEISLGNYDASRHHNHGACECVQSRVFNKRCQVHRRNPQPREAAGGAEA